MNMYESIKRESTKKESKLIKESMYSQVPGVTDAMYDGDIDKVLQLNKKHYGDTEEGVAHACIDLHSMQAFNGSGPNSYDEALFLLYDAFPEGTLHGDLKYTLIITQKLGNRILKYYAWPDYRRYAFQFDEEDEDITKESNLTEGETNERLLGFEWLEDNDIIDSFDREEGYIFIWLFSNKDIEYLSSTSSEEFIKDFVYNADHARDDKEAFVEELKNNEEIIDALDSLREFFHENKA